MVQRGLAYFFLGFISALVVVELTNGKPPVKLNYNIHEYSRGYDYYYRPLYYRSGDYQYSPYSRGGRSGSNNGSNDEGRATGTTETVTQSFNHTGQERQDSWGTKN